MNQRFNKIDPKLTRIFVLDTNTENNRFRTVEENVNFINCTYYGACAHNSNNVQ